MLESERHPFFTDMQTLTDETTPDVASPEPAQANPYIQALAAIETQLEQLSAAFSELDKLRAEETELLAACEQIAGEERALLENPGGNEKQATDKLLRIRATRDVRQARLDGARKKLVLHVDLLIHDLGEQLRHDLSNLAYALFRVRSDRFQKLFFELLGPGIDHGLMVTTEDLARRSKPVLAVEGLYNWIGRDPRPTVDEELAELRSDVPARWLAELRAIVEAETK
jgi:hypothetical protein